MPFKIVDNETIKRQYDSFLENRIIDESMLDNNYLAIRKFCLDKYYSIKAKSKNLSINTGVSWKHYLDTEFGFELYKFLHTIPGFNAMYESNYDFWKYLACFVIPDVIADRWDVRQSAHFYSKVTAIYPFQVYWYIHLSWQGSEEETREILKDNQEDHILQLVDRPGSIGVNVELFRKIMKKLSSIPVKERKDTFRYIMMKNTSKLIVFRPEVFPGGIDGYVDMLFENS